MSDSSSKRSKSPKLRTASKVTPPYLLNKFPAKFINILGREIVYLLATRATPDVQGADWEQIFAKCIEAEWKPSNVGLDDIVKGAFAWGAKTVKARKPSTQKKVRLISGRNSPAYSFETARIIDTDPNPLGEQVLAIWNARVDGVRSKYKEVRTVILIKSNDLRELAVFEFETIRYPPDLYMWSWNKRGNLQGYDKEEKRHIFTWQPHGSQFTIIENVPQERIAFRIKQAPQFPQDKVLEVVGFDESWIEVLD